eukprot:352001-Chlamydomonas_euryale.AAC.3
MPQASVGELVPRLCGIFVIRVIPHRHGCTRRPRAGLIASGFKSRCSMQSRAAERPSLHRLAWCPPWGVVAE